MILGTAGHIDHGKTALVRALTGVDTDRLPEEKRRGITIELGFAPLVLPDGTTLGIVDVPGHEAFVRTMLAGATGVDLALLVVAADEGVMPQTREHAAILSLLGIRGGVVALTKRDLVEDDDWLALVADDVRELLAGGPLADAPVVPVSAQRGTGMDELREAISAAARALPVRDAADVFRMPVDRAFTVKGTGTVVTGTVWSGALARDAAVRVFPGDRVVRVRGVQAHGAAVDRALPGARTALALAGVDVSDVARGAVLVGVDDGWRESRILRADVALLADAPVTLGARARVRFHLGTADVGARVVTAGGALAPGDRKAARIVLDEAVVARAGDRFVLRLPSPATTIGGGVVVDAQPPFRRARPIASAATPAQLLRVLALEASGEGIPRAGLAVRLGVTPREAAALVAGARDLAVVGDRVVAAEVVDRLADAVVARVAESHLRAPLEPGISSQSVRSQLHASAAVAERAVERAAATGRVEIDGALLRQAGWRPTLTGDQAASARALLERLATAGAEPPTVAELTSEQGQATPALLRLLEREGKVVTVDAERVYEAAALGTLVARLREAADGATVYSPADFRDILGLSRRLLIPFLEYCDRAGVTERLPDGRRVRAAARPPSGTPATLPGH